MIEAIQHVALMTSDIERAARFYTEVVGFHEVDRLETTHSGTIIFLSLEGAGTQLELFGGGKPRDPIEGREPVGYRHIALRVDDVDAECARLKSLGVEFMLEPTTSDARFRLAFFRDPDGNPIELIREIGQR